MRVCYLSTDPGISIGGRKGAAIHVGEMVEALVDEGAQVLLLAAAVEDAMPGRPGLTVEILPGPGRRAPLDERLRYHDEFVGWLIERLYAFQPHALYERLALYSTAGAAAAGRVDLPHLVELNAPLLEEAARYRILEAAPISGEMEAATLRLADAVLAVSPPLVEYARRRGARRVELLQNAAALEKFTPSAHDANPPRAVFAGSLRPWHGLETVAEAWRLMGSDAPPLFVVGDGPARELISGIGAQLIGSVAPEAVPQLIAAAEIGLAPYGRDTPRYFSPIKLFEYLAAGLATVVGDLPAVSAIVDGDSAVVIPAGDAPALARAVARLATDADERRRLGRNGRALIASGHTWRHRARRVLGLIDELSLTRQPAPSGARG